MASDIASKQKTEHRAAGALDVSEIDILRGMLAASNDACWCMEFAKPVDLTAPDHEVVRQIFENGPVWHYCNVAMERLYQLPTGQDMNARPVHEIFPNNPSNQDFIHNLIANGFEVDGAPALDRDYSGMEIYVENDVRAHISDGKLYRMFGTVRNVGKHRRREQSLKDQLAAVEGMIAALPNPFLAIGNLGTIEAVNPAGEGWLGQSSEVLLGRSFEAVLLETQTCQAKLSLLTAMGKVQSLAIPIRVQCSDGQADAVWQIAPRETPSGTGFVVMVTTETKVGR